MAERAVDQPDYASKKGRFGREPLPWQPLPYMEEYLSEKEAQLRATGYISKVKMGLAHFSQYMLSLDVNHPELITRHHLIKFLGFVNTHPGWGKRHQIQILKYVKGWIYWLHQQGYIETMPWVRIRINTIPKTPNPLADEELALLFEAHRRTAFTTLPFVFHRREIILTLLYGWGLRIHELVGLNVSNMDVRLDYVTAPNKGGGVKALPYPPPMKLVVQRWLTIRARYATIGEDALIIDRQGNRLAIDGVRKIIVDMGARAGVTVHPHQLRDTCGTHLLDSDMPLERVARVLGHTNVSQTRAYARVNDHKVAESHDAAMTPRLNELLFGRTSDLKRER